MSESESSFGQALRRGRIRRPDGPHLSPPAAYLRCEPEILPPRARPIDRRPLAARQAASVLEIGCGTGRNLIKLAKTYPVASLPWARCLGRDARHGAPRRCAAGLCAPRPPRASGCDCIRSPCALRARELRPHRHLLRALDDPALARGAGEARSDCLAPGGSLHIVDFGDQAGLPAPFRFALNRWLALFHVTPRETLAAELAQLAQAKGLHCETVSRFGGYALCAVIGAFPAGTGKGQDKPPPGTLSPPVEFIHIAR